MTRGSNNKTITTTNNPRKAKQTKPHPARITPSSSSTGAGAGDGPRLRLPLHLQEKCLHAFHDALKPGSQQQEDDLALLQQIKTHLYHRDFAQAFGNAEYLRVYASRWSPSRALAYLHVLADVRRYLGGSGGGGDGDAAGDDEGAFRVVCLGGGAGAELVAFAGWAGQEVGGKGGGGGGGVMGSSGSSSSGGRPSADGTERAKRRKVHVELLDIADWGPVVERLYRAVTLPRELSLYASAAAQQANIALAPAETFTVHFQQTDVLGDRRAERSGDEVFGDADMVTLMFTLNELYSSSVTQTQQLLARITASLRPGALLLVVDSAGSYSTVSLQGGAEKVYPMHWLLDYTLVGSQQRWRAGDGGAPLAGEDRRWEKVVVEESKWFRLPEGLHYPLALENMRYQIHLYRRL